MQIDVQRLYSPKELLVQNGGVLPISLSALYSAMRCGEIPYKVIGKRKLISGRFIKDFLDANEKEN